MNHASRVSALTVPNLLLQIRGRLKVWDSSDSAGYNIDMSVQLQVWGDEESSL